MKRIVPKKIEQYCQDHTNPESKLIQELVAETFAHTDFSEVNYPRLKTGGMSREGCEQLVDKEA